MFWKNLTKWDLIPMMEHLVKTDICSTQNTIIAGKKCNNLWKKKKRIHWTSLQSQIKFFTVGKRHRTSTDKSFTRPNCKNRKLNSNFLWITCFQKFSTEELKEKNYAGRNKQQDVFVINLVLSLRLPLMETNCETT